MNDTQNYVMGRIGPDATPEDAAAVLDMASRLAEEQGDRNYDPIWWLSNRTYELWLLLDAANGDVAALVKVRAEAGLPILS